MHFDLHVLTTNHTRKVNDTRASIFGPVAVIEDHRRGIMLPRDLLRPISHHGLMSLQRQ